MFINFKKDAFKYFKLRNKLRLAIAASSLIPTVTIIALLQSPASAQSPEYTVYALNTTTSSLSWPSYYGLGVSSSSPNAVVEEGGVMLPNTCYSESGISETSLEDKTVSEIDRGIQVITEITVVGCGASVNSYAVLLSQINNYVMTHASNAQVKWGGFMMDEEPGYGFSVTQCETLNHYLNSLMGGDGGQPWYFVEAGVNGWAGTEAQTVADYNTFLSNGYPAPQAYSSSDISIINNECSEYGNCTNLVTVDSTEGGDFGNPQWVTSQIGGSPWYDNGSWGSLPWVNIFQP